MTGAVVLAAGASRRMGSQKLLLPFAGATVIGHVVDVLLDAGLGRIVVVTGRDRRRIAEQLGDRAVACVHNRDWQDGMLSSVRAGLRALPAACSEVLLMLGDQPGLDPELVVRMIDAFRRTPGGILVPAHRGRRGHPLMFDRRYQDEILRDYDDVGLRGLLRAHPEDVRELEVDDETVLLDADTPEAYRRAVERFPGQGSAGPPLT